MFCVLKQDISCILGKGVILSKLSLQKSWNFNKLHVKYFRRKKKCENVTGVDKKSDFELTRTQTCSLKSLTMQLALFLYSYACTEPPFGLKENIRVICPFFLGGGMGGGLIVVIRYSLLYIMSRLALNMSK